MTDKQIIINGVDVSGCEFLITNTDKQMCRCIKSDLFGGIEFVKNAKNGNCKDNPNCYYKQLKRKEQECEELKFQNKRLDEVALYWHKRIFKVERSERKLKQTLAKIEKLAIRGDVYCIDYNVDDCEKCIKQSDCKTTLFKQILEKINEVENEKI